MQLAAARGSCGLRSSVSTFMCVEISEGKSGQMDLPAARDVSDGEKDPSAWGLLRHQACGSCCTPVPRSLLASPSWMQTPGGCRSPGCTPRSRGGHRWAARFGESPDPRALSLPNLALRYSTVPGCVGGSWLWSRPCNGAG